MINITPALTCSLIALFLVAGCSEEITTPSSDNPVEPTALGEPVDFSPEIPDLRWSLTQYDNGGVLHNVDPLIPDPNYFKFNILTESLYSEERVIAAQFNCKVYQWEFRRTSATTATLGINEFVREASNCLLNEPLPPILDVFTHYTDIVMDVIDQKMRITNGNGVTLIYSAIES